LRAALASAPSEGSSAGFDLEGLVGEVRAGLQEHWETCSQRVLNATGVFLHTNLGRAPLAKSVAAELVPLLDAATDVELELDSGRRGDRNRRAGRLLAGLVGAHSGVVVNNNAAALVLILAEYAGTHRDRREVVVSRGELVEIGGSFRIPDILRAAGCTLVEVGTTNRTRLADYRVACSERTGLLLKVHPSNYRVRGFTEETTARELVKLGQELEIPVVVDEGSGLLRPSPRPQLQDHTSLSELVEWGVTLVCGSADKLLGGPQAGLICGGAEHVERLRRNPLYRAFRPSRQILVALEATLRLHLRGAEMPIDRLWEDTSRLEQRLESLAGRLGATVEVRDAFVGGGAAPDAPIPGPVLTLPDASDLSAWLRQAPVPVVGYARDGRVVLDLRTVDPSDDESLARSVEWACRRIAAAGSDVER
jgi:L-seryl-tRNA(Ser) seleniumtransferase